MLKDKISLLNHLGNIDIQKAIRSEGRNKTRFFIQQSEGAHESTDTKASVPTWGGCPGHRATACDRQTAILKDGSGSDIRN